ncbi:tRNA pseudouridine(13) synthase TruD [Candidatus Woesearchaeota archaeon]|nr:tRNA pseudouridine(13) synthase TruD [Candidatus Woesearchaeota archaeon]
MYKIKQHPEDFIVKEITNLKPKDSGSYTYIWLKKKNYTTLRAIETLASKLKINSKSIGFAGTKDKSAVTEQLISIKKSVSKEKIANITLKDIELNFYGYGDTPLSLGDLIGNQFIIIVRNLEKNQLVEHVPKIPNYFGQQRFSRNNAEIGKAIIKKYFKKAVELILENTGDQESKVLDHITHKPNDFVGALRKINIKILRMYVHSYQSYIWNKTLEKCLKDNHKVEFIPILGFGTELGDSVVDNIIKNFMDSEIITLRDFIIPQIPELSAEGDKRKAFTEIKDLEIKTDLDELNKGMFKQLLTFSLPKGSYATTVIEELYKSED